MLRGLENVTGMTPEEIEDEIDDGAEGVREQPGDPRAGLGAGKVFFLRENQSASRG